MPTFGGDLSGLGSLLWKGRLSNKWFTDVWRVIWKSLQSQSRFRGILDWGAEGLREGGLEPQRGQAKASVGQGFGGLRWEACLGASEPVQ